jgi:HEAT repeat protein
MTTGSSLYDSLRTVVRSGVSLAWEDGLSGLIEAWEGFTCHEGFEEQWKQARRLVWCACQASTLGSKVADDLDRTEFSRRIGQVAELPDDREVAEVLSDLLWGWTAGFRLAPAVRKCVAVPVALYEPGANRGLVATLKLSLIEGIGCTIFPDPVQALITRFDERFLVSARCAWTLAKRHAQGWASDSVVELGGSYHLVEQAGQSVSLVDGQSAGGALLRGWWYALTARVPDEGVFVLAALSHHDGLNTARVSCDLKSVSGVKAKVVALLESGHTLDTIIVSDDENRREAESTLRAFGRLGDVRVVNAADLLDRDPTRFLSVRSRLAEDLEGYYTALMDRLDQTPWGIERLSTEAGAAASHALADMESEASPGMSNQGPWSRVDRRASLFQNLYVRVRVVEGRRDPEEARRREQWLRAGEFLADESKRDKRKRAYTPIADETHRPDPPLPWHDADRPTASARRKHTHAVLLGDPGLGKTLLLQYEGWLTAREQVEALRRGKVSVDEAIVPVSLRLADLASLVRVTDTAGELARLATRASGTGALTPPSVKALLREKLQNGLVVLLLDGLDEIPDKSYQEVVDLLAEWVRHHPPQRLYLSSRIVGYRVLPREFFPSVAGVSRDRAELELVSFTPADVHRYINTVFGDWADSETGQRLADELWTQLEESPAMLGLCQTPLLLTLTCLAFAHTSQGRRIQLPATRSELYAECLEGLLGRWPHCRQRGYESSVAPVDEEALRHKRELLAVLAWELSAFDPEHTLFTPVELKRALESPPARTWLDKDGLHWLPQQALNKLTQVHGVLTRTGVDLASEYMFIHRSFQEYLLAWALIRREKWLSEALKRVYDASWTEVLALLGGVWAQHSLEERGQCGAEAGQFVEALERENGCDLLSRPLLLACRVAGEAWSALPPATAQRLTDAVVDGYLQGAVSPHYPIPSDESLKALAALGQSAEDALTRQMELGPSLCRYKRAVLAFGRLGYVSLKTVAFLRAALQFTSDSTDLLVSVPDGQEEVKRRLLRAAAKIKGHGPVEGQRMFKVAAQSLARLGRTDSKARYVLLLVLCDTNADDFVREEAAVSLGDLGWADELTLNVLREALHDPSCEVRQIAADSLRKLGCADKETVAALRQALGDSDSSVRKSAVQALAEANSLDEETLAVVRPIVLSDPEKDVRYQAADVLGRLGRVDEELVETFREALDEGRDGADSQTRATAVCILGALGRSDEATLAALRRVAYDDDSTVYEATLNALQQLGQAAELPPILHHWIFHRQHESSLTARSFDDSIVLSNSMSRLDKLRGTSSVVAESYRKALVCDEQQVRYWAAWLIGTHDPHVDDASLKVLRRMADPKQNDNSLEELRRIIGRRGQHGRAMLDPKFAKSALDELEEVDGLGAARFREMWNSQPNEQVNGHMAVALLVSRHDRKFERSITSLRQAFSTYGSLERQAAISSLGRLGQRDRTIVDVLHGVAQEGRKSDEREMAVESLGQLNPGDGATRSIIRLALKDPEVKVRQAATKALGLVGRADSLTVPMLRLAMAEPALHAPASKALWQIGIRDRRAIRVRADLVAPLAKVASWVDRGRWVLIRATAALHRY